MSHLNLTLIFSFSFFSQFHDLIKNKNTNKHFDKKSNIKTRALQCLCTNIPLDPWILNPSNTLFLFHCVHYSSKLLMVWFVQMWPAVCLFIFMFISRWSGNLTSTVHWVLLPPTIRLVRLVGSAAARWSSSLHVARMVIMTRHLLSHFHTTSTTNTTAATHCSRVPGLSTGWPGPAEPVSAELSLAVGRCGNEWSWSGNVALLNHKPCNQLLMGQKHNRWAVLWWIHVNTQPVDC